MSLDSMRDVFRLVQDKSLVKFLDITWVSSAQICVAKTFIDVELAAHLVMALWIIDFHTRNLWARLLHATEVSWKV